MQYINEKSIFTIIDIYSYIAMDNVKSYKHENMNSYLVNTISTNLNSSKSYYLILDTLFSMALFHWFAECAIFLPLFKLLKFNYPNLKIVFKTFRNYHKLFCDYFDINFEDICYSIDNYNNICFFPKPITALNDNSICDEYIKYVMTFIEKLNDIDIPQKNNNILIMPRQNIDNSKTKSGFRINNCNDIINNLHSAIVLNTDNITELKEQINLIKLSKTIILTDGSPYLLNGLIAKDSKIIVLGDIVISQTNNFIKMNFFNELIKKHNDVIFIPYIHGTFDNSFFLYDDINGYIN